MVKLSEQLQKERVTRTERVEERQRVEAFGVEQEKRRSLQEKINKASEKFKTITFEEYEAEFNKLDDDVKPFFLSPAKFKETDEFKEFERKQEEFEQQKEEFERAESERAEAEKERSEWEQAQKIFLRGLRHDPRSSVGRKVQLLQTQQDLAREKFERSKVEALKEFGVTPVRKGAVIVAFKDEFGNVSFDPKLKGLEFRTTPTEEVSEVAPTPQAPIVEDVKVEENGEKAFLDKSLEELFIAKGREKLKKGALAIGSEAKKIISFYFGKVKDIPSGRLFFTPSPLSKLTGIPTGAITPFKTKGSIDFTEVVGEAQEDLAEKKLDILVGAIGEQKVEGLKEEVSEEFQAELQEEFERKHLREIAFGEKTFEEAEAEFQESKEAKSLQEKFDKEFNERFEKLSKDVPILKGTIAGTKIVGLSFAQLGLSTIKTPKSVVLTGATIPLGVGVLRAIPQTLVIQSSVILGTVGTLKTISPTATVEERGAGFVTAVLSGATLGVAGVRFLRSPIVRTVKIKAPKPTLRTSERVGRDLKIITEEGVIEKTVFESQKLSQQAQAGQRTIVTTRIRNLLRLDPIFKGVSPQDPKGFQKALKKLTKFGFTEEQARRTLRFTAPRVTDQTLKSGVIQTKGEKALGRFEFETTRPVITVDEALGIKTRGARTIRDVVDVERQLIKGRFIFEEKTRASFILDKSKVVDFKDFDFSRGVAIGRARETRGFDVRRVEDLLVFEEAQIKELRGLTISRKLLPSDRAIRIDTSTTKLISKTIDLRVKDAIKGSIQKTPFSRTFGSQKVEEVKDLIRSKPTARVEKVVDKIEDVRPQELRELGIEQLKTAPLPETRITAEVKNLINIRQLDNIVGVRIGTALSTKALLDARTDLKLDTRLKQELKTMINLKDLVRTDVLLKAGQLPAIKQAPAVKQQLKLKTTLKEMLGISLTTPTPPRTPKIPEITIPSIPIPLLFRGARRKKKKGIGKGVFEEFGLLPDFTARAIGLDPDIITGKQAQERIKKILTGLEVRRGAIIR